MVDQLLAQNATFVEDFNFTCDFVILIFSCFFVLNLHIVISNSFYNTIYIVKMLSRRDVYDYFM
jgi:hypothetical protein